MADIEHIQYDELPVRRFTLPWKDPATGAELPTDQWPALNSDDKVSLVMKQGVTDRAVRLTKVTTGGVTLADRKVDWAPASPENTIAGTFEFRIRVTQADGKSYSCPGPSEAPWKLIIKPATSAADVAEAA